MHRSISLTYYEALDQVSLVILNDEVVELAEAKRPKRKTGLE